MEKSRLQSGLTMIEILIVVAIIGLLVVLAITQLPKQISKGRDARRKSDLQKIKIAFEDYFSDKECYPPPDILENCGSNDLSPYMASIPCDPQTKTKYLYAPEAETCPHYYRVYSNLELDIDPIIKQLGCQTSAGCGAYAYFGEELGEESLKYDYGVSEGVPVYESEGNLPPETSGWCCNAGVCNSWTQSEENICIEFYTDQGSCDANCGS
jgi:prepilin-type N-terminal cleavage/methylation domain-containing protein